MDERARECTHLDQVLSVIHADSLHIEERRQIQEEAVAEMQRTAMFVSEVNMLSDLMVQEFLLDRLRIESSGLKLAKKAPYFSRIDFTSADEGPASYYIGKFGVLSPNMDPVVIDWRSPIANLYYSGQVGKAHYVAPDGVVDGDLTLKRMFTIADGKIKTMLDVDLVTQDELLTDALAATTSDRLKEVVTTIQAEQNAIIRHPMRTPLIVQGVAGSGKTTIALHRVAYLLYLHADTLAPQHLMILAPNPLFLQYISSVLPDLGVERAGQSTFVRLSLELLGNQAPHLRKGEALDDLLGDPALAQEVRRISRIKGSLAFGARLALFLDAREKSALPKEEITFGPLALIAHEELERIFLHESRPFPWRRRFAEIRKVARARLKDRGVPTIKGAIEDACAKKAAVLRALPEGEGKRARMQRLYQSRDERIAEVDAQIIKFRKEADAWIPDFSTQAMYLDFLREENLPLPDKSRFDAEDLPALLLIQARLGGFEGRATLIHILVDEAQDFSPLALMALRDIYHCGFTLVGDMGQGIYRHRGMDSWDEALEALPSSEMKTMRTSYRSTVEIIDYANQIALRHPYPGQVTATPVLRHGDAPTLLYPQDAKQRNLMIAQEIARYRAAGMHSIAVLARDGKSAAALHASLTRAGVEAIRLLDPNEQEYQGGVLIAAATAVKGLEFDAVVVQSASDYPDDLTGARLLYVGITRALHRVTVLA